MSNASRPLVVVNPRSGGGRAGRTIHEVRAVLERRLGPVDLEVTGRPNHAVELAHEAASRGRGLVIAVGGDGTLHEVANGVLDARSDTAIGYVGQGTGGDFRRTLGIEHRLDAYVEAIASGRELRVDVGQLSYRAADESTRRRWFVNVLSVGLGGLVDGFVSETTQSLGGRAAYFWATLRALARCQRGRLRCMVTLAGARDERLIDTFMIAICNGAYFGSGMQVAPMAKLNDGQFEVVSMNAPNKLAFATSSLRIYDGKHLSSPGVQHFACDRMSIDLENETARGVFLLDVDGEPLGGLPMQVKLVPQALRLRA
ncbi:MAG: diacylglycerol kinase family lipid kinase [Myxococcota bacterium]|nr:diacylglycerol kinase family lipid kinase [Myxococcota bacterium]